MLLNISKINFALNNIMLDKKNHPLISYGVMNTEMTLFIYKTRHKTVKKLAEHTKNILRIKNGKQFKNYICKNTCFHICIPLLWTFLARLYESTGRAIAVTTASASASASASALVSASALLKMLKVLVKVFKSLCLLSSRMDLVDT